MFRVVLPVDSEDDRALRAAEIVNTLPKASESVQVTILNVQENLNVSDEGGSVNSEDWFDENDLPQSAINVREYLGNEGITVDVRREHADPADAIIDVATEIDADRIIMSGRKRSPTGKVLFGSVTQSVLLDSDIPVTAVFE